MNLSQPNPQYIFGLGLLLLVSVGQVSSFGQQRSVDVRRGDTTRVDTTRYLNTNPFRPSFRQFDRYGDPFSTPPSSSPFFLGNPSNLKTDVVLDTGKSYSVYESIGGVPYRSMSTMSFDEYVKQQERDMLKGYWQGRSKALDGESAVSSRNLIPKIYISPVLDRIFGGSYVEIIPRGFVTLDFGASFQNIENPVVNARQQKNGGFEFDQQISLNVVGKIGEKLSVTTNFDNNNSFDFQNNMKVEYTGFKEDILKKLELGNVSLPLNNSLIVGAQNLFGVKAQMQFGKMFVTTIATTQRGKQNSIEIQGSTSGTSQGRPFEIVGSNYDDNRHFFLAQFFRNQFENWLSALPQPTSGVNVTRVEVYLVNRTVDTQTLRNLVGFMDMGESDKIYRTDLLSSNVSTSSPYPANNENNDLFTTYLDNIERRADTISYVLEKTHKFKAGTDFEKITSARKLAITEFTFHKELGYITLQRKLQNDEALAVAFEYTYNGRVYKVGELSEDYSNLSEDDVIFLKLLRPRKINLKDGTGKIIPSWNLMMKNIYNLNVQQLTRDNFQLRIIYRDDRTGIDNPQLQEGEITRTKQLVEIVGLDQLNPYNDPQPDGNFDFVEKITVNTESGLIIFPYLEPFNTPLRHQFAQENPSTRDFLISKYVYDTLYHTTKAEAELVATKNKFWIVGSFKAGSGKEIIIQGFGISPGSVKVYAGGTPLLEGTDYTVDYTFGKVTMMNEGILSSGKDIRITYEQQDPFAFQTRSLIGTRFDYKLSEDINIGSTLLYYNERPLISRNLIGTEPARNLQYGLDLNLRKDSRVLTKLIDALPFLQTKEVSNVTLNAEFAQLLPGTSNIIEGEGTSFIDDFENTATPYSLHGPVNWRLSTTPLTPDNRFDPTNGAINDVRSGSKRAKLAWYTVDNSVFYVNTNKYRPESITDEDLKNHYVRPIKPQEIFPNRDNTLGNFNQETLDLAYFPSERGPYNYNTDLNSDGTLKNPASNWAGITTAVRSEVDFDKANIEYVEFWLMDPFINSKNGIVDDGSLEATPNTTGGQLIFHLGSISEDLMRDGKHAFENGLPEDGNLAGGGVIRNEWGYVTTSQYLNNAFDNNPASRPNQDVGLDGANNATETKIFSDFLSKAPPAADADPSADDFMHFLDPNYDAVDATLLQRYKKYGGLENNSPVNTPNQVIPASSTTIPNNEDLNQDNTLSDLEEYYVYSIDLKPGQIQVGKEYVVDQISNNENGDVVTWYLFRIPVRQFEDKVGAINDFKSIRYGRLYLTGFIQPVVLRLANFRTVGNRWRRYAGTLAESQFGEPLEPNLDNFSVSVVNVEENAQGNSVKPGYVSPLARDRDITSAVQRRLNEQSVQLCITELPDGDGRSIYKNVSMDLFNYGRMKMFISAFGSNIADGELTGFVRLGTDFDQNYYEIELPLVVTAAGTSTLEGVWPDANQIDLDLNELYALKATRDRENFPLGELYPRGGPHQVDKHGIRILGRPDMSQVKLMMIGVRNPRSPDAKSKNVCIWANELRVTDFDRTAGWAGNMVLSAKLADLGTVTGSLRHITFGYGGVQSKIYERSRGESTNYDISTNLNLDKLLPQKLGLKIPLFASYENKIINPKYDPANPDMRLQAMLLSMPEDEQDNYLKIIRDRAVRRSLNFTNVRRVKLNKEARSHIWDVENFAFTYAYSEATQTNFSLAENTRKNVKGGAVWQYNTTFKGFEPFSKSKGLKSPYLQLIKDFNFNPLPTNITVRGELDRSFSKIVYRNSVEDQQTGIPNFQKFFIFNRFYNARWALTKGLSFEYAARVNAIIDEPDGDIDTEEKKDIVKNNLKNFGRMKNFEQTGTFNYTVPLDKFPLTNWLGAEYRYNLGYSWRAGPLAKNQISADSLKLGNIIQNNRDQTLNGRIDFVKLYNKIGFLKEVNTPKRPLTPLEKAKQAKAQPDTVRKPPDLKAVRGILRLLMSVRNINGSYSRTEGTILPGYTPSPYLFGMDKSWSDPGWAFILGSQDPTIRYREAERGLMTKSEKLTTAFSQTLQEDLSARANIEPASDLKVVLDIKRNSISSYQEIYRYTAFDSGNNVVPNYESLSPSRTGSYRISTITIGTAFKNNGSEESEVFHNFENNVVLMKERFNSTGQIANYEDQSQDVLIPAFISAYRGTNPDVVPLTPFPQIPLPNWRVDYNGLNKIGNLKDVFQAITISHAYTSTYSVSNFTNSLQYEDVGLNIPLGGYNNGDNFATQVNKGGGVVPVYVISQVMISETFAPLIGINVRTKNKFTARFDYKTKRDLMLNIPNAQVTESLNKDWAFELGYTKNNLRLPIKDKGRVLTLKNDVTFKLNVSVNDTRTIQRMINDVNKITNGNLNFQLRPNISYVVNQKLNVQIYYDRNVNDPRVSSSYPRTTTRFGTKIMFNLAQ